MPFVAEAEAAGARRQASGSRRRHRCSVSSPPTAPTHPGRYRLLAWLSHADRDDRPPRGDPAGRGDVARQRLEDGFRSWLGPPSRIAVDPETGLEYRWEDVVAFADDVDDEARRRCSPRSRAPPLLREGIFLFSGGATVRLDDILPQGVWVRLLGSDHGKSVYRVAVKTRDGDQYRPRRQPQPRPSPRRPWSEEIDWLILCGEDRRPAAAGGDLRRLLARAPAVDRGVHSRRDPRPRAAPARAAHRKATSGTAASGRSPPGARSAPTSTSGTGPAGARRSRIRPRPTSSCRCTTTTRRPPRVDLPTAEPYRSLADLLRAFRHPVHPAVEARAPEARGARRLGHRLLRGARDGRRGRGRPAAPGRACARPMPSSPRRRSLSSPASIQRGFLPRRLFFAGERYRRWARAQRRRHAGGASRDAAGDVRRPIGSTSFTAAIRRSARGSSAKPSSAMRPRPSRRGSTT